MQASQCRSSKKLLQQLINESPLDGILDGWKTKPVSYHQGREYLTITKLSQYIKNKTKYTKYPHQVERSRKLGVLKQQQASKGASLSFKVLIKMSPYAI
jgi:hypothetical protein